MGSFVITSPVIKNLILLSQQIDAAAFNDLAPALHHQAR
jgi:hypothetical protein